MLKFLDYVFAVLAVIVMLLTYDYITVRENLSLYSISSDMPSSLQGYSAYVVVALAVLALGFLVKSFNIASDWRGFKSVSVIGAFLILSIWMAVLSVIISTTINRLLF